MTILVETSLLRALSLLALSAGAFVGLGHPFHVACAAPGHGTGGLGGCTVLWFSASSWHKLSTVGGEALRGLSIALLSAVIISGVKERRRG